MKKIISLFQRNYDGDRLVRDEVVPGAEWVVAGEGIATRKYDGTCCMVRDGSLYRQHTLKAGRTPPPGFEAVTEVNPTTGKQEGWVPVGDGKEDRWHREAWQQVSPVIFDGTYELCGPKVQGNPERLSRHVLIAHGHPHYKEVFRDAPRTYTELKAWFVGRDIEGIVWRHRDGRMVKIKKRDFGLKREA